MTVLGGDGNDYFWGGDGDEVLVGEIGNDYLDGGAGNDILVGGADDDYYYFGRDYDDDTIFDTGGSGNGLSFFWGWEQYAASGPTAPAPGDGIDLNDLALTVNGTNSWTVTIVDPVSGLPNGEGSITFDPNEISFITLWSINSGTYPSVTYDVIEIDL